VAAKATRCFRTEQEHTYRWQSEPLFQICWLEAYARTDLPARSANDSVHIKHFASAQAHLLPVSKALYLVDQDFDLLIPDEIEEIGWIVVYAEAIAHFECAAPWDQFLRFRMIIEFVECDCCRYEVSLWLI
jgi:hypothetical protein